MSKPVVDPNDNRWGEYVPWVFRHADFKGTGNFLLFFGRLTQRLYRMFYYNEPDIKNHDHFGEMLESKSLQRFRYNQGSSFLAYQIERFFDPDTLKKEMEGSLREDPEYKEAYKVPELGIEGTRELRFQPSFYKRLADAERSELNEKGKKILEDCQKRIATFQADRQPILEQKYYLSLFIQRLSVLETLLTMLPKTSAWVADLVTDIRRYFAEAYIMLDIDIDSFRIKLLEEPLLQKEVIENLLPRLSSKYPKRAKEFTKAYHDMLTGEDFDEIFVGAFKTLEELARSITEYDKFEFKEPDLRKYFPKLHSTIHATMIRLNAHRGDEGGHAKKAPDPHEMRYLLFSIMNIALLLLDYQP